MPLHLNQPDEGGLINALRWTFGSRRLNVSATGGGGAASRRGRLRRTVDGSEVGFGRRILFIRTAPARVHGGPLGLRTDSLARFRSSLRTSLFRNSLFLLLTSALGNGLGFLFWLAVAQSYPAADVGRAATVFAVVLFLAGAGSLGLPYGIMRFLPSEADK